MNTPPPPPDPPPAPGSPPPPPAPPPPPPPAAAVTDKFVAAFRNVNWKQLGMDFKSFGGRFFTSDFSRIQPEPHEQPAVAAHTPRMAALVVWRRALLMLACVLSAMLLIKKSFDPMTYEGMLKSDDNKAMLVAAQKKAYPQASDEEIRRRVDEDIAEYIKLAGESNINVINAVSIIGFCTYIASLAFLVMAAKDWRSWRRSKRLASLALLVILLPELVSMLLPWSAMMDFGHLKNVDLTAAGLSEASVKLNLQGTVIGIILINAIPLFYSLFNGILRASLAAKTLIPASIVCGWGTILLALTIAVPWFLILSIVDQMQADALIFLGVLCLLMAPLSIVFWGRRLGKPLLPEEATTVVKKSRHLLTGLNLSGALLLVVYLNEKNAITASQTFTGVIHYFANLMLISVVAVDVLVLLLDRAHRKLAADTAPEEPLRQLGEVLPGA